VYTLRAQDPAIYQVFVNIENPYDATKLENYETAGVALITDNDVKKIKEGGYDGIIAEEIIVFEPDQIKIVPKNETILESKSNEVNYNLRAADILMSDKAKQIFTKGEKVGWDLNKILTELQIPKDQKQLILDLGKSNREEIITDLLANYSYTIEVNTSMNNKVLNTQLDQEGGDEVFNPLTGNWEINPNITGLGGAVPTQHYSNLTVPGGTNYTENEIATPTITPSIKGHAQFSSIKGIGWFRSDEQTEEGTSTYRFYEDPSGQGNEKETSYGGTPTKTRRILEVQSDWGQKQRKSAEPDINVEYDIQQIINDLQKSGDLKIDCN
jgi:hypothetical protein